jgi:ubiquinol-cytochrome c reductase cytochrome c1 subunit
MRKHALVAIGAAFALTLSPVAALSAMAAEGTAAAVKDTAAVAEAGAAESEPSESATDWESWKPGNSISSLASLQRGARNFMGYCVGCHSLKYMRYSRMAADLKIPDAMLEQNLVQPGDNKNNYIIGSLAPADGEAWFGKAPPDLSLIARAKGTEHIYQFLKTFYAEPGAPTGVNNLALPGTAMPHVLAELQGVQTAVFKSGALPGEKVFAGFKPGIAGRLSAAEYDDFVRDIVNFLDYVGEPTQLTRQGLGVWVVLFLLAFTGIAFLLKNEYWKDVK